MVISQWLHVFYFYSFLVNTGRRLSTDAENINAIQADLELNNHNVSEPKPQLPTHYSLSRPDKANPNGSLNKDVPDIPQINYDIYDFSQVIKVMFNGKSKILSISFSNV